MTCITGLPARLHGEAQLSADGRYVLFAPEPGYTGAAFVRLVADDGANMSAEATIPVTISGAPLVSLDIQNRLPRLNVGGREDMRSSGVSRTSRMWNWTPILSRSSRPHRLCFPSRLAVSCWVIP